MKKNRRGGARWRVLPGAALAGWLVFMALAPACNSAWASDTVSAAPQPADIPSDEHGNPAVDHRFQVLHQRFLKQIAETKIGLLFLGDSIMEGWRGAPDVWTRHFGKYDPANFGINGDYTQHVLWRIENGELDGIDPKVVVLLIGTNNIGHTPVNSPQEVADGIRKIVAVIHQKLPAAKVLLLGEFPRGSKDTPPRRAVEAINEIISKFDDGGKTRYLDLSAKFVDADGNIIRGIMPDAIHPNVAGREIWAEAMQPLLDRLMR